MNINSDKLFFEDDMMDFFEEEENEQKKEEKWKLMIVDDESDIHNVTKMVLKDIVFDDKEVEFLSAYSGKEGRELIKNNPDTAVILLDVVMEEDNSGLNLVKYIREELGNKFVRIILRTGYPGEAPEKDVILNYDINDYKEKTELTSQKLFTSIISGLRSYKDILTIDKNKKGLEKIISASSSIFELQSMKKFASGVLTQLISIMNVQDDSMYIKHSGFTATRDDDDFYILAATGSFYEKIDCKIEEVLNESQMAKIYEVLEHKKGMFFENYYIAYFYGKNGSENLMFVEGCKNLDSWEQDLIEIFGNNVAIAFDNINLNKEMEDTQKEIIFTLGEIVEVRSEETGNHVRRVSEYAKLLARMYGLSESEVNIIKMASPMHDIGKVGIPDSILNKPGKLTDEEMKIMKTHAELGYEMLRKSNREIIKAAAEIAYEHHEKWDGTGYPRGLKGEEINIMGRIVAITDVFDALSTDRVYRPAWDIERVIDYMKSNRGKHFDPKLIDILFENIEEFLAIKERYAD